MRPVQTLLVALFLTSEASFAGAALPRPDHIVVVIEENRSFSDIIGNADAPYINALAKQGALFTNSTALTHPSQPNYIALFSGSTQGVEDNSCPHTFSAPNLGGNLIASGFSFIGYSEDLPEAGSTVCYSGAYARKHNPWVNFSDIPAMSNLPFSHFPTDFSKLPTIAFVMPNQDNDMHDGTIGQGDAWLKTHLDPYVQWAQTHNSLFIFTFDEDDGTENNRIVTLFVGPMVTPGEYAEPLTLYSLLRTLEDMYALPHAGASESAAAVTSVWREAPAPPLGSGQKFTALEIENLSIRLNFSRSGRDSIHLSAPIPVAEGFEPANQSVIVDVGGVVKTFTLDNRGAARTGHDALRLPLKRTLRIVRGQSARLAMSFSRGDFAATLRDEGFTDEDVRDAAQTVGVRMLFDGVLYGADVLQIYSARKGSRGRTR